MVVSHDIKKKQHTRVSLALYAITTVSYLEVHSSSNKTQTNIRIFKLIFILPLFEN